MCSIASITLLHGKLYKKSTRMKCGDAIGCSGCAWLQVSRNAHFPKPLQQLHEFLLRFSSFYDYMGALHPPPAGHGGNSAGEAFDVFFLPFWLFFPLFSHYFCFFSFGGVDKLNLEVATRMV